MQAVTWHDYEEGTEIQSGIDNCLTIGDSVSGNTLSWSVADESTLDHYTIYISTDGQNLMSLGDYYVGTHSLDLSQFQFAPGTYQVFVKAVGKPSIRNNMSAPAAYTVAIQGPPVAGDQHSLQRAACWARDQPEWHRHQSERHHIAYQIYLDGRLVQTLGGEPSSQSWVSTTMGLHHFVVKAEDATQQWGTALVWDQRTY